MSQGREANMTGRGSIRASGSKFRAGKGTFRAVRIFNAPHTNFEIQKYDQNDVQLSSKNHPKFDGVDSGINLSKKNESR